ncbi:MAG: twin-arginine translocase subunit TatC [Tidjanibacter sp.]|nr:twin-arginine translocase subunit TatC [Tidjanibacter sp.]
MADGLTFWDHLDELKHSLVRIVIASLLFAIVAFLFKDELFGIILGPQRSDFVTYRLLGIAAPLSSNDGLTVSLINTGLAQQFMIHMRVSFWVGLLCASPYIIFTLFRFVWPALYTKERRNSVRSVAFGFGMFLLGVALCYFLIFPITFRFLATYTVSDSVPNMITLDSYISTLLTMSVIMGVVFELPVLCLLLARLGVLSSDFMKHYRRHAILIIVLVAAIITPTGDPFTLLTVSVPIYLLYELSILMVRRVELKR